MHVTTQFTVSDITVASYAGNDFPRLVHQYLEEWVGGDALLSYDSQGFLHVFFVPAKHGVQGLHTVIQVHTGVSTGVQVHTPEEWVGEKP
jgi:hypothetical protein